MISAMAVFWPAWQASKIASVEAPAMIRSVPFRSKPAPAPTIRRRPVKSSAGAERTFPRRDVGGLRRDCPTGRVNRPFAHAAGLLEQPNAGSFYQCKECLKSVLMISRTAIVAKGSGRDEKFHHLQKEFTRIEKRHGAQILRQTARPRVRIPSHGWFAYGWANG